MADHLYNYGSMSLWNGTIDLLVDTIKVMLVTSSYSSDKDDHYVDDGGANDPTDHELSGTGYTSGFGNSGRKTLAGKGITIDLANDRSDFDTDDVTWSAINAGTAAHLISIKEVTNDAGTEMISHHDFSVTTNGGDVTAQIADMIRLTT